MPNADMTKLVVAIVLTCAMGGCDQGDDSTAESVDYRMIPVPQHRPDKALIEQGKQIFRHDTFNDERFWTDTLRMHEVIAEQISPKAALSLGLKVDSEVLPPGILGQVDLDDPATTVALLELDAVVGVKGKVVNGELVSVGVTCALCHSTVDDSVLPGIGKRLDGHANSDLEPGPILAASPFFSAAEKEVLESWPAGFYDPRWNQDGINGPVVIPPAYGLRGVARETYTGDGPISYWNAYVAVTQMGAQGIFVDPRIDVAVVRLPDLVTPKLPALLAYQLSLVTPAPLEFDPVAAKAGRKIFHSKGKCDSCHIGSKFTDVHKTLHDPAETGVDPLYATRSVTKKYRTTPLRGLQHHPPYFHDGSQATLEGVVDHYDEHLDLGLTDQEKHDLVEYLKSL